VDDGKESPMPKTDFKSVDEYIASQPEAVQAVLQRVRSTIRNVLPGAECPESSFLDNFCRK
jgi:uncharacterized protein YdhG (YjbR/CyaY superfamily)